MERTKPVLSKRLFQNPVLRAGFFSFVFLGIAALSLGLLEPRRDRPREPYLTPPEIRHLTFGTQEQTADLLWLRAVQDFDYCENEVAKQVCQSTGWLFRMLDLITDLSPQFRMPYAVGGLALTVLVNDFEGASRIFDKAVQRFPKDDAILARAAYHALYEEKDKAKASRLLRQAAEAGAPPWYYLLANRVATEQGDLDFTRAMIAQLEAEPQEDSVLISTLKKRLQQAEAGEALPPAGH